MEQHQTKLNIGGGGRQLDGYTDWDIKQGRSAFPLPHADNSVAAIRASHILEHFSYVDARTALAEWLRVLVPGGLLEVSVPDVVRAVACKANDHNWRFYIAGGQTDEHDQHLSVWDEETLKTYLQHAGFENITFWAGDRRDNSHLPVSCNLKAVKPQPAVQPEPQVQAQLTPPPAPTKEQSVDVSIYCCATLPRIGWNAFWGGAERALAPFNLRINTHTSAFPYDKGMQWLFSDALAKDADWILAIDYDTMFTSQNVSDLFSLLAANPDYDAIAPVMAKRSCHHALGGRKGSRDVNMNEQLIEFESAHFGLTVLRASALRRIKKPWFQTVPDSAGEYSDHGTDADVWFWRRFREAGCRLAVASNVRVGHLEEMVTGFGDDGQHQIEYVREWRERNGV